MPCLCGFPKMNPPKNASQKRDFHFSLCHCATPFDTFFVNPFDTLLSSQNRSQNRTATCTTHTPHPKMKISRLQNHLPELLFSLFFLLIFVLLSDTFATFFAIFIFLFKSLNRLFSRLSGTSRHPIADSFFLFLRQKNLISGESPETRFLVVLWYF